MAAIRTFPTGATRDDNAGKLEYARALDPVVLTAFVAYMKSHQPQPDGTIREPDNWKFGFPDATWVDSLVRHVWDLWIIEQYGSCVRPETGKVVTIEDALGGILFNAMGRWREHIKATQAAPAESPTGTEQATGSTSSPRDPSVLL